MVPPEARVSLTVRLVWLGRQVTWPNKVVWRQQGEGLGAAELLGMGLG